MGAPRCATLDVMLENHRAYLNYVQDRVKMVQEVGRVQQVLDAGMVHVENEEVKIEEEELVEALQLEGELANMQAPVYMSNYTEECGGAEERARWMAAWEEVPKELMVKVHARLSHTGYNNNSTSTNKNV